MKKVFWLMLVQLAAMQVFSQSVIYQISNCNGEDRTMMFSRQIQDAEFCAKGKLSFKKAAYLRFSQNSKINLDSLDKAAIPFSKAFPKTYWDKGASVISLNTKPNEDGHIWFEYVYVEEKKENDIKPLAAFKVVFEGSDAEKERVSPKIQEIIMTSNPTALKKYIAVIKRLKRENNIKSADVIKVNADAPPPPIRNL
jgi:hypothetical protein